MAKETAEQREARMQQEQAQGYIGPRTDVVDDDVYTVSGVTRSAPTPETDRATAEAAVRKGVLRPSVLARLPEDRS